MKKKRRFSGGYERPTFQKLVSEILLQIELGSVVVINSLHLDPLPTSAWRKSQIIDWLIREK